jgi:aerobic-type carbon monoxide dehydrogenase small subunit (CoxS/CutS family)
MRESPIRFRLNGAEAEALADADTPLLYVLRNDLEHTGTRFGCGSGACGSCMVLLDGRPVNSCDTPLWAAEGHEVTTVEGLGTPQNPHPVQQAFIELQAAQCGYCINGIMMSVAALRERGAVSEAQLQEALARHLCRCGTHWRILRAARQALGLPLEPA